MAFTGFHQAAFDFFVGIALQNNKAYFEENRKVYERELKEPLRDLAAELGDTVLTLDPNFFTRADKICARIRRDTRFTKDKSPYRNYLWIGYNRADLPKNEGCGLYFAINATSAQCGGGIYGQNRTLMAAFRRDLEENPHIYQNIFCTKEFARRFQLFGDAYKKMKIPPSLPENLHALYQMKSFYIEQTLPLDSLLSTACVQVIKDSFLAMKPFYEAMEALRIKVKAEEAGNQ